MPGTDQRGYVQGRPHVGSATPHLSPAAQRAAVSIQRRHPYQGGDLLPVELTQLRQLRQERHGRDRPDAGRTPQEIILLAPPGAGADLLSEIAVQVGEAPLKPANVLLDVSANGARGQ